MGGNLVNYPGDCGTPTANLLTVKLLNSVISTPQAKFMTIDIKDFYLMTPMERKEYFRIKMELFPEDVIDEYNLRTKSMTKDTFSVRYTAECTGCHKQDYLPKSNSSQD